AIRRAAHRCLGTMLHPRRSLYSDFALLCYFFHHCSVHHRHLHSFPTRRSSDLSPARASSRLGRDFICGTWFYSPQDIRPDQFRPDRKSTRLNSSHVASSYAVFCLKKKDHFTSLGERK